MKNVKSWLSDVGLFMSAVLAAAFVLAFLVWVGLYQKAEAANIPEEPTFDVSALAEWCGEPVGHIRMVGAWVYEDGVLEDETGNLWGWDGDLDPDGFFLLWIDDMGDDVVQNDEIVKLWQEIP